MLIGNLCNFSIICNHSGVFQLKILFRNYLIYQKKMVLRFSKNVYCLRHFLQSSLNNIASTFFIVNWHIYFFVYYVRFSHLRICFLEIYFSAFIKDVWFALINLRDSRAIEFKTVRYVSWNLSKLLPCLDRLLLFSFEINCSQKNLLL